MKLRAIIAASAVAAMPVASQAAEKVYNSLPTAAKILIEQTRKSCREAGTTVTTGDDGLVQFYLDKSLAVLVDDYLLCSGECSPGVNCSNRGTRGVEIYVRRDGRWDHVLSEDSITGQIFFSMKPARSTKDLERNTELHALVVSFYRGNKDCPTWDAGYASAQSWAAVSCVIRWNGSKFTYKPL